MNDEASEKRRLEGSLHALADFLEAHPPSPDDPFAELTRLAVREI